ncbi:hypothetical protein [Streptomyces sp. NPDC058108]|uniref:hypothetical protein n=1 Tax=Streptomyces sp. NPDC058108 TaxID=3346344 RepID=UPI0036E14D07
MSSSLSLPAPEGPEYTPCACGHIEPDHESTTGSCWSCDCESYRPVVSPPAPAYPAALRKLVVPAIEAAFESFDPERTEDAELSGHLADAVLSVLPAPVEEQRRALAIVLGLDADAAWDTIRARAGELADAATAEHHTVDGARYLCHTDDHYCDAASGPGRPADETQQDEGKPGCAHCGSHDHAWNNCETYTALVTSEQQTDDEPLVHVGWWCWRGGNHGHLATMACRSDNVPIHVPAEWETEMRAVIQRLEDGDDEEQPEAATSPEALPLLFWDEPAGVVHEDGRITAWLSRAVNLAQAVPAGQLILQLEAGARLRSALTTALLDADEAQEAVERAAANCRDEEGCNRIIPCNPGCATRWPDASVSQPDGEA